MIFLKIVIYLFFAYSFIFLFVHIFIAAGIILCFKREKKDIADNGSETLKVSVIIPAKDEELTLPSLLESLVLQLDAVYEIILINDRSKDSTLKVMESFREKYPKKIKVINNIESAQGKNPKQLALAAAENIATGDIFLYTDADCIVPEEWITYMIKPFADKKTGLVFGTITVDSSNSLLDKFQKYDHLLRYYYTAACAGLGTATGGFGNNLAVRREALMEIGGFRNLRYSITEDAQLIAEIRNTKNWKIVSQTSANAVVRTTAVTSWKELFLQELRWSSGAMHAPDFAATAGYGFIMYQLLTGIIMFIPAFFYPQFFIIFFTGIVCMFLVSLLYGTHLKLNKSFWINLPLSILIAQFIFPVITFIATFKIKIIWKGEAV